MASRVLYGLASRGQLPSALAKVGARTQTPTTATVAVGLMVLVFALFGRLAGLAQATSTLMLLIFAAVNLSLWRVKASHSQPPTGSPNIPRWLCLLGFVICSAFVLVSVVDATR